MLIHSLYPGEYLWCHPKSWFTSGLNQLKAVPEDSLSPTSALQVDPPSAITPFTPSLPLLTPLNPDEKIQLPLSKEMALYVTRTFTKSRGSH